MSEMCTSPSFGLVEIAQGGGVSTTSPSSFVSTRDEKLQFLKTRLSIIKSSKSEKQILFFESNEIKKHILIPKALE